MQFKIKSKMNFVLIGDFELEITNETVNKTVMYRILKSPLPISGAYSSKLSE